jgi:hypothetical protein
MAPSHGWVLGPWQRFALVLILGVVSWCGALSTRIQVNNEPSVIASSSSEVCVPPASLAVTCEQDTSPQALGFASSSLERITFSDTIEEQTSCKGMGGVIRTIHRQWVCSSGDGTEQQESALQVIVVRDSAQPPIIEPLKPVLLACNASSSTDVSVTGQPVVSANCTVSMVQFEDSPTMIMCHPETCQPQKIFVRTFHAIDQCNNAAAPMTQVIQRQVCDASAGSLCKQCQSTAPPPASYPHVPLDQLGRGFNCFSGRSESLLSTQVVVQLF